MTRIKCCGMTRVEDALLAASLGVDAIGLVFASASPRRVELAQARKIRRALPPFVAAVALFMDNDVAMVDEVMAVVQPDLLQFHGRESNDWCLQFDRPWLKAIAMRDASAGLVQLRQYPDAAGLLLDGHGAGEAGGSGRSFDWSQMPGDVAQPLILAGGLHADNVAAAIRTAYPWAVDVASGVESEPGIKDARKLAAFVHNVRSVRVAG